MRKRLICLLFIANLLVSPFIVTLGRSSGTEEVTINILFDETDSTAIKAAQDIFTSLRDYYHFVNLLPICNIKDLNNFVSKEHWINVYVFHGSQLGMLVGDSFISWEMLAEYIGGSQTAYHILESCNSEKLDGYINSTKISVIGNETDIQVVKIHALTQIMSIFEGSQEQVLVDISKVMKYDLICYVVENLSELINLTIRPEETLDDEVIDIYLPDVDAYYTGPWGWFIDTTMSEWLNEEITPNDWYDINMQMRPPHIIGNIEIYEDRISESIFNITKADLGKGDSSTKQYDFDIPLEMKVNPQVIEAPYWMEEAVDIELSNADSKTVPDFTQTPIFGLLEEALGVDVEIECEHNLWGTIRVGNLRPEVAALIGYEETPVRFLGGGYSASTFVELDIPVATFLNYIVPSTGSAMATILETLGIKVDLICVFELVDGIGYDEAEGYSTEHILVRFGIGFQVEVKLPTADDLIEKAIGFSPPLSFITLGVDLRGLTGIEISSEFTPTDEFYDVGVLYEFGFNFFIKLFWFFKISWGKSWKDEPYFNKTVDPSEHSLLDNDADGLWDSVELKIGLDINSPDTDGDTLSDGNEVFEFNTNPLKADSDNDGINDNDEIALFFKMGLDYHADYDNDGLPSILDRDSDNDLLTDLNETKNYPYSSYDSFLNNYYKANRPSYYNESYPIRLWTDPSLPDTDFDGLTDYQELEVIFGCMKTGRSDQACLEYDHTDPKNPDTDGDGILDGPEKEWLSSFPEYSKWEWISYLLDKDIDNDLLSDFQELGYNTNPYLIDTDGDFDLNGNNQIDYHELVKLENTQSNINTYGAPKYGDLTDYGEVTGNYWPGGPFSTDLPCSYPWPAITNPTSSDTDNDNFSDLEEWFNESNPMWIDSDGDGLENSEEADYGANCTDPDSDDDGLWDGYERDYFRKYFGTPSIGEELMREGGYLTDPDVDDDRLLDGLELVYGTDILVADTDSDGLIDSVEVNLGTYPLINDTDRDDLLDGQEVNTFSTNPKKQDTDNDTLPDAVEAYTQYLNLPLIGDINFKTDPNDPDSDDDGLIDGDEVNGWVWATDNSIPVGAESYTPPVVVEDGKLFLKPDHYFPDPYRAKYQTDPTDSDTDDDGLTDGEERDLVLSPLTNDTDGDGLSDFEEIEIADGFPVRHNIWHYLDYDHDGLTDKIELEESKTLPYDQDTDNDNLTDWEEHRIILGYYDENISIKVEDTNRTVDIRGTEREDDCQPVCKKTDPTKWDTDGDGLSDYEELKVTYTDPLDKDSDDDDLNDYNETRDQYKSKNPIENTLKQGLDPLNPDTDGDGILDGVEVQLYNGLPSNQKYNPMGDYDGDFDENILDPDSDNDGIFDGVEYYNYSGVVLDIFNQDKNNDGVLDGKETDLDGDGLTDYTEVYTTPPGYKSMKDIEYWIRSHNNLASTNDNVVRIEEVSKYFINHTMFGLIDTDNDTLTDGQEIKEYFTDPLNTSIPYNIVKILEHLGKTYHIRIQTEDKLSNLELNTTSKQLTYYIDAQQGPAGFCNISIPKNLLNSEPEDWKIFFDDKEIPFKLVENPEHNLFSFEYPHSNHRVAIQGTYIPRAFNGTPFWINVDPESITVRTGDNVIYKYQILSDPRFEDPIDVELQISVLKLKKVFSIGTFRGPYPIEGQYEFTVPEEIPNGVTVKGLIIGNSGVYTFKKEITLKTRSKNILIIIISFIQGIIRNIIRFFSNPL